MSTPEHQPNFRLDGKVAMVTGAASGIGRAIAMGLAGAGADVACLDLPGPGLTEVVAAIGPLGRRAIALPGDVTDHDGLADAAARVQHELGPLRLAVNSAGIANAAPAEEMDHTQWQRVIDVDLTGVFLSCQAQARAMLAARSPAGDQTGTQACSIVNIASMSGSIVNRGLNQAHYNAAKAGVIQLTKSLAMEWCGRGIRVNAISPGYTATPMNTRPEVAEQARQFESDTPMGRMASVHELVGPAIFLLSDAASFCTGTDLLVDGGFTCW